MTSRGPLDAVGVPVVGDELEAVHQFVSLAKYLAADRRMSRSSSSLVCSARSALFSASSRAIRAACDSGLLAAAAVGPAGVVVPVPYRSTHVCQRSPGHPEVISDRRDRRAWRGLEQAHRAATDSSL